MPSLRVSVSDLETYRYYLEHEEVSLEYCLAQLRRETAPSPAMAAGSALHSILEHSSGDEPEALSVHGNGYTFNFACNVDLAVPDVRELKGEMLIETPSGPVTLVGVIDAMDSAVCDYKLTGRFDAEKYADSHQWRCYLLMFNASKFVYRVFVGKEVDDKEWTITDYHEFPVYRYPGMEEDVVSAVSKFAEFSSKHLHRKAA